MALAPDDPGRAPLSPAAAQAWAASLFAACSPAVADELLAEAREIALAPGATFYRGSHHEETEKLGLVVEGLLRTFRRSLDGRQVTLRYASPGRVIGLPAVLGHGAEIEGQALSASRVLVLSAVRFRAVARRDADLAWQVAEHLAGMVRESNDVLSAHLCLPVRSRVARHLLDMAVAEDDRLVVHASHQDLADAIGSVREVVSRTLRQLHDEGYVEGGRGALVLVDPSGLHGVSLGIA